MPKDSPATVLSKKQRKASRKACERYQDLSKDKKVRRKNMIANDIKIFLIKKTKAS